MGALGALVAAATLQPVVGAACLLLERAHRRVPGALASLSSLALLLTYVQALLAWRTTEPLVYEVFSLEFFFDGLSALLAGVACFIGFLCILYSYSYMDGEEGTGRFFFWMLTFVASMVLLATANSLLVLVAAWELTGLCSYSLISFWATRRDAAVGSLKAILVTEAGSSLLVVGLVALESLTRAHTVTELLKYAETSGESLAVPLAVAACLALVVAALTKSAQFPFHVWLPDAMAAPTPVSALLHAAAMVKAGVYLLARFWPVIAVSSSSMGFLLAVVGSATMIVGGLFMLTQSNVKRLLAYSTVSQLGYMTACIGLGSPLGLAAALFHLLNHAVIKGLLFLSAGSAEHGAGTKVLDEMGGLATRMPVTAAGFVVGSLSLAGVPPFNGFVSKLLIYAAALMTGGPAGILVAVAAFVSSAFSAAALLKASHSAFFGYRPPRLEHTRESPTSMTVPIVILVALTLVLGLAPGPAFKVFVASYVGPETTVLRDLLAIVGRHLPLLALLVVGATGLGGLACLLTSWFAKPAKGLGGDPFLCGENPEYIGENELHLPSSGFFVDAQNWLASAQSSVNPDPAYTRLFQGALRALAFLSTHWGLAVAVALVALLTVAGVVAFGL